VIHQVTRARQYAAGSRVDRLVCGLLPGIQQCDGRIVFAVAASSTGCLVVLSPPHTSPAAETLWYTAYAAALSLIGIVVVTVCGKQLTRHTAGSP
jgi:hypothetical protein